MLVLERKDDESIVIDNNIEIKIIKSEQGKVKIGIEAPKEIEINRKELLDKVQLINKESINKTKDISKLKKIYKKSEK